MNKQQLFENMIGLVFEVLLLFLLLERYHHNYKYHFLKYFLNLLSLLY